MTTASGTPTAWTTQSAIGQNGEIPGHRGPVPQVPPRDVRGRPLRHGSAAPEDTAFLGMLCSGPEHKQLKTKDWVEITAKVRLKNLKLLGGEGPVLYTTNVTPCAAPADPLIYF